jgi:hypothetical protein
MRISDGGADPLFAVLHTRRVTGSRGFFFVQADLARWR